MSNYNRVYFENHTKIVAFQIVIIESCSAFYAPSYKTVGILKSSKLHLLIAKYYSLIIN